MIARLLALWVLVGAFTMAGRTALTMAEIRKLPATVDVETAALVLGIARSTAYDWIRLGQFPGRVISVKHRHRVVTASLIAALEGEAAGSH
jgi:Helix-turn-helix domain